MKIDLIGIDSCAGALYPGTELAPNMIRKARLVERLRDCGFTVHDHGDLLQGNKLPQHNIGPVRNWPAPRVVWEMIQDKCDEIFKTDTFSIILGGDCSIEVGAFHSFRKTYGEKSHLLVIDGHVDTIKPSGELCVGAAGMGLWFLTQDQKVWWKEEPIGSRNVKVIGAHTMSESHFDIEVLPLEKLSDMNQVSLMLKTIPEDANIFVHFDVDVLHESVMPAAYSPSKVGLDFDQACRLMSIVFSDSRVKGIEVTEFSADKDTDGKCAEVIVDLLCMVRKRRNT